MEIIQEGDKISFSGGDNVGADSGITQQAQKEEYSLAYILAIAASAGFQLEYKRKDYGVDAFIEKIKKRADGSRRTTGFTIDFQLKATQNWKYNDNHIVYALEVKNYNDMISRNEGGRPLFLGLLCLPHAPTSFYPTNSSASLILRNAMYWYSASSTAQASKNKNTITIYIPIGNLLTPDALSHIMYNYESKGGIG